jgi:phosphoglycerate-specific signal transduction histidine kinase
MKEKSVQLTVKVTPTQQKELQKLAVKQHISLAELLRRFIDKGISVDGHADGIDFIRRHIREELSNIINPKIERLVKLAVKSGVVSAAAYFLNAEMLAEFIPLSRQRDLQDALLESKKQGVVYFNLTDSDLAEFAANDNKNSDTYMRGAG